MQARTTVNVNFPDQSTGRSTTQASVMFQPSAFGLRIVLRKDDFLSVDVWLGDDEVDALEAALAQVRSYSHEYVKAR